MLNPCKLHREFGNLWRRKQLRNVGQNAKAQITHTQCATRALWRKQEKHNRHNTNTPIKTHAQRETTKNKLRTFPALQQKYFNWISSSIYFPFFDQRKCLANLELML